MREVAINLLWHPQAQFAGYLVAERKGLGAAGGVRLRTVPLDLAKGPVAPVLAGECAFGVASPAHLLESAKREELRLLLVFQQESPLVYPVRKSLRIARLDQLAGRRAAVWPGGEDLEFRWMLRKAGVPLEAVERIEREDTVEAFLSGEADCAQMTVYHELHVLEARGVSRRDLCLFTSSALDAALVKDGLFTTRTLVEREPGLVQSVVNAVLEGWRAAFADPREALAICLAAWPGLEAYEQEMQLKDIRTLTFCHATLSHGLGYPNPHHARRAAQALADLGHPVPERAVEALIEARFWQAALPALKVRR